MKKLTLEDIKKNIKEIVDFDMNLINGSESGSSSEITSHNTTDQHFNSVTQKNAGHGAYYMPEEDDEELDSKSKAIAQKILTETETTLTEVPTFQSLQKHYPIVSKNLAVLLDSVKRRDVDSISDSIIINEILNTIDVTNIPRTFLDMFINKLKHD